MPYWNQSKRFKAMNEKKPSKKTRNSFISTFNALRQVNCQHQYRDGKCIKCNVEELTETPKESLGGEEKN